jgi:hypothetical protein
MTVYTFNDKGSSVEVKNGGDVHLEFFAGEAKNKNLDPHIGDAMSSRGWDKSRNRWSWDSNDTKFAMHLAVWAIKKTRSALPYGTFNNSMIIDGAAQYLTPTKTIDNVEKQLSPKLLADAADQFHMEFAWKGGVEALATDDPKPDNLVESLAARAYGARLIKGGVCSLVSHVCLGYLTMGCPAESEAAVVYHGADHSFCVMRYKTSPWIVVDPWVRFPYAIPWGNTYFGFKGLVNNYRVKITKKVDVAFGVTVGGEKGSETELRLPQARIDKGARGAGIRLDATTYPDKHWRALTDVKKELKSGDYTGTGNFHYGHVWGHKDNLSWPRPGRDRRNRRLCATKALAPYGELNCQCCFRGDPDLLAGHYDSIKPACGPDAWGGTSSDWEKSKTLREMLG